MNDQDPIKWDKNKKKEREQADARERLKRKVGTVYQHWKNRFLNRSKRKTEDIVPMAQELRDQVRAALVETGLENDPFGQTTMKLIEEKLENLKDLQDMNLALGNAKDAQMNILTRFLPDRPDGQPQTPETYEFRTEEELNTIDFVRKWTEEHGFVGLLREGNHIYALFESSEMRLIGAVATRVGVEKIPTVDEFRRHSSDNLKRN